MLIDRRTGRFVRRFDTGPTSEREGFDGARAWRADATGLARVQGNVDQRGAILADSYLFARAPAPAAVVVEGGGARVRYRGVSRALDLAPQPDRPLLARCAQPVGEDVVTTSFDAYGSAAGLRLTRRRNWCAPFCRRFFNTFAPEARRNQSLADSGKATGRVPPSSIPSKRSKSISPTSFPFRTTAVRKNSRSA